MDEPPWVKGLEERLLAAFRDDLHAAISSIRGEVEAVRIEVKALADENAELRNRVIAAEARDMRNNLILRGPGLGRRAPDTPRENWDASLEIIRGVLTDLGVDAGTSTERVHRLGGYRRGHERPIVVKFTRFRDKETVLNLKRKIREMDMWWTEQFPSEILDFRRRLREAAERKFGKLGDGREGSTKVILSFDRLKANGVSYTLGDDDTLVPSRGDNVTMRQRGPSGGEHQDERRGRPSQSQQQQQPWIVPRGRGGRGGNRGRFRSTSTASPGRKRLSEEEAGNQAKLLRQWATGSGGTPGRNGTGIPQHDGAADGTSPGGDDFYDELSALVQRARARRCNNF
jgi:hypothetical protein